MITSPLNNILQCDIFFLSLFLYFWVMCLFSLNCADSLKCLCTPLRWKKKKKSAVLRNTSLSSWNLWMWRWLLSAYNLGIREVFENCYKTMRLQVGQSMCGQDHREDPSQKIIPKCISRMNFLFLPSFGINYFSFSMGKKSEKFVLCLSLLF